MQRGRERGTRGVIFDSGVVRNMYDEGLTSRLADVHAILHFYEGRKR